MALTTLEGRQQLLDGLAEATDEIGFPLAALAAAYEQLDEHNGDRLEEGLFRPTEPWPRSRTRRCSWRSAT